MGWKSSLVSLAVHAGAIAAIGLLVSEEGRRAAIAVAVRTLDREEEPKPPPPPPKPAAEKKVTRPLPAAPKPVVSAQPEPAGESKVLDLGIMLGSDAPEGVGVAVPMSAPPKPKVVVRSEPVVVRSCEEAPSKPQPIEKVAIEYPMQAREAGISGRLVARVFVDERGEVENVEIVESAGEVIDRAAIEALRRWKFTASTACGKAVKSRYTVARRFELGD